MRSQAELALLLLLLQGWLMAQGTSSPPEDTAALIGVSAEIAELNGTQPTGIANSEEAVRVMALRQQVYERILSVSLEVDATTATIDNEIARATEVRGLLADRRDRAVTRANLWSALLGGGLGATSAALQISSRQTNTAASAGIAGGAISAGLALYGIRAQVGGARGFDADSNMLARFFDRPEVSAAQYPPVVWRFLSEIAPSDPDHLTRRERLMHTWFELKRLDRLTASSGIAKVERVTSTPAQHLKLTVDDLEDRTAMLLDVRAKLSYLKRDLAVLLASLSQSQ